MAIKVVIRGAGPVAQSLALMLLREGLLTSQIFLQTTAGQPRLNPATDLQALPEGLRRRALALSYGSKQLLGRIGVVPDHAPISEVEISLAGQAGRTWITAAQQQRPSLGMVVRYEALVDQLNQAMTQSFGVNTQAHTASDSQVVVHAEGTVEHPDQVSQFDQTALLADLVFPFASALSSHAFERFTAFGPLALLPLPQARAWTLVWCDTAAKTQARLQAPAQQWLDELAGMVGARFGTPQLVGPVSAAPLKAQLRQHLYQAVDDHNEHHLWVGNAARALHPVAGQGLNLGLRDVMELAQTLGYINAQQHRMAQAYGAGQSSLHSALQQWSKQRQADQQRLFTITNTLAGAFTLAPLRGLQSLALASLQQLGFVKSVLAAQLMFGPRDSTTLGLQ
jgi:2-octaprenyl-6-methoxyphenol hydroxylase